MPLDPRLDQVAGAEADPVAKLHQRVADLERRLGALERGDRRIYSGQGAPAISAPSGSLYVDELNLRLYTRAANAWHYAVLT
jgi:hypothetical protein